MIKNNLLTVKSNTDRRRKNNQQQPWRLKAAATLISNHKSKLKIISPSKNTFQSTDALQNSSNVNEVIRKILNFFIIFFIISFFPEKILHAQQAQKAYKRTKIKKVAFLCS